MTAAGLIILTVIILATFGFLIAGIRRSREG